MAADRVYRAVAHIQGNRMCDLGTTKYGPPCATRAIAQRWMREQQWRERYSSVSIESQKVITN